MAEDPENIDDSPDIPEPDQPDPPEVDAEDSQQDDQQQEPLEPDEEPAKPGQSHDDVIARKFELMQERIEALEQQIADSDERLQEHLDALKDDIIQAQGQAREDAFHNDEGEGAQAHPYIAGYYLKNDGLWHETTVDDNGTVVEYPDGRVFDPDLLQANDILGTTAFMEIPGSSSGDPVIWKLMIGGGGGLVPVRVDQSSGSAGSSSAYTSYKYDVTDITGTTTFASDIALTGNGPRHMKLECVTTGTYGWGYWSGVTFVLLWVDEQYKTTVC